jgi:hypothetical protein
MEPAVQYDEGNDVYELGISVDGTFVSVFTVAGSTVRARIEAAQQNAAGEQAGSGTPGTTPPPAGP